MIYPVMPSVYPSRELVAEAELPLDVLMRPCRCLLSHRLGLRHEGLQQWSGSPCSLQTCGRVLIVHEHQGGSADSKQNDHDSLRHEAAHAYMRLEIAILQLFSFAKEIAGRKAYRCLTQQSPGRRLDHGLTHIPTGSTQCCDICQGL